MLDRTDVKAKGLADLPPVESDLLLALIALAEADPRPEKIDVGVGVYRDGAGRTPILQVIKEAERRLVETQASKSYLGSAGDKRFAELLRPILLGEHAYDERIVGVQTPGGTGAVRLGMELVATVNPDARVLVGTPTWPNHPPMIRASGLETVEYSYYERAQSIVRFDAMTEALSSGRPGDIALLHGCCHNPTGADLDHEQWAKVTRLIVERGLIPFVDIAYQGFGRGLNEDAHGLRGILSACDEVVIAQSCDKNFSVYRDRVGSLFLKTGPARPAKEPWRMSTSARERCGRCRLTMARPPCISCSKTTSFERGGMSNSPPCAIASIRYASASRRRIRGSLSSAVSMECFRCSPSLRSRYSACAPITGSTWPIAVASTSWA